MKQLMEDYKKRKEEIQKRLSEFAETGKSSDERIFAELAFCLCTPQSRAEVCWDRVSKLFQSGKLFGGDYGDILNGLRGVRFLNNKTGYIVENRAFLRGMRDKINSFDSSFQAREWLVKNIKGFGYKEASHFLRNIGKGGGLAILDRHILKNLREMGVIELPKMLSRKRYIEIEEEMKRFSEKTGIPLSHLDLLFWSRETGKVFK